MLVDLLEIFGEVYHDSLVVVLLCYLPELHLKQKKHEEVVSSARRMFVLLLSMFSDNVRIHVNFNEFVTHLGVYISGDKYRCLLLDE